MSHKKETPKEIVDEVVRLRDNYRYTFAAIAKKLRINSNTASSVYRQRRTQTKDAELPKSHWQFFDMPKRTED